jgi:hypothetical protein
MTLRSLAPTGCLALAGLVAACDSRSPAAPTASNAPSLPPGGPQNSPLLNLLELSGPSTIAPGSSARFIVTASYGDGSFRDVTTEAAWRSRESSVLSVSAGGVVTAHARGQTFLEASFEGRSSGKTVTVLPDGTFRFTVRVHDAHVPVQGARVTVYAGPAGEFNAATASAGSVTFFGVAGDVEVRVIADGYLEYKERLRVTDHQTLDTVPTLASPREVVEGIYTLTISAASECRSTLPDELMQRKYGADIAQIERGLIMTLTGPTFYSSGNRRYNWFRGTLYVDRMTFGLSSAFYEDYYGPRFSFPEVFDQLTSTTFFSMSGSVVVTGNSTSKSGTLDGTIEALGPPPQFHRIAACRSGGHRVDLVR